MKGRVVFWKYRFDAVLTVILILSAIAAYLEPNIDTFIVALGFVIFTKIGAAILNIFMTAAGRPLFYHHKVMLHDE